MKKMKREETRGSEAGRRKSQRVYIVRTAVYPVFQQQQRRRIAMLISSALCNDICACIHRSPRWIEKHGGGDEGATKKKRKNVSIVIYATIHVTRRASLAFVSRDTIVVNNSIDLNRTKIQYRSERFLRSTPPKFVLSLREFL